MTGPMSDADLTHIQSLLDRGSQAFSRVYVTDLLAEVKRLRSLLAAETATARDLMQRNVELGTRAENAKAACEDLREERDRLAQVADQRGAFATKLSAQLDEIGEIHEEWGVRTYGDESGTEVMRTLEQARDLAAAWRREIPDSDPTTRVRTQCAPGPWRDAE